MKNLLEDVWSWSRFSEEKQLDFNGLYLRLAGGPVLVDPVPFGEDEAGEMERLGAPIEVVITNKHHTRAAAAARSRFGSRLRVAEADRPLMEIPVDGTFRDGDRIAGSLEVLALASMKTPGESALYWRERRLLILGDALIAPVAGELRLLPPDKVPDPTAARRSLNRLRDLDFDVLLVGDGQSFLGGGRQALESFLASP